MKNKLSDERKYYEARDVLKQFRIGKFYNQLENKTQTIMMQSE